MKMQMPAEFTAEILLVHPKLGTATATVGFGKGKFPTKESWDDLCNQAMKSLKGSRLATKKEYWDYICMEKSGVRFAMPGATDFED